MIRRATNCSPLLLALFLLAFAVAPAQAAVRVDETTVTIDGGGNLVITDIADKNDGLTISIDGGTSEIVIADPGHTITDGTGVGTGGGTNEVRIPAASVTGDILVDLGLGTDEFTVDSGTGLIPFNVSVEAEGTLTILGADLENADFTAIAPTLTIDGPVDTFGAGSGGTITLRGGTVDILDLVTAAGDLQILQVGDDVTPLTLDVDGGAGGFLISSTAIEIGDETDGGDVTITSIAPTPLTVSTIIQTGSTLTLDVDIIVDDGGAGMPTLTLRGNLVDVNAVAFSEGTLSILQPGDDVTSLTLDVDSGTGGLFSDTAIEIGDETDGGDVTITSIAPIPLTVATTLQTRGTLTLDSPGGVIVDDGAAATLTLRGNLVDVNTIAFSIGTLRILQPGDDVTSLTLDVDTGTGILDSAAAIEIGDETDGGDVTITSIAPTPLTVSTTIQTRGTLTLDDDVIVDDGGAGTPTLTLRGNLVDANAFVFSEGTLRILQPGDDVTSLTLDVDSGTGILDSAAAIEIGDETDGGDVTITSIAPTPLTVSTIIQTRGTLTLDSPGGVIVDDGAAATLTLRGNLVDVNTIAFSIGTLRILQPGDDVTSLTLDATGGLLDAGTEIEVGTAVDDGDVTIVSDLVYGSGPLSVRSGGSVTTGLLDSPTLLIEAGAGGLGSTNTLGLLASPTPTIDVLGGAGDDAFTIACPIFPFTFAPDGGTNSLTFDCDTGGDDTFVLDAAGLTINAVTVVLSDIDSLTLDGGDGDDTLTVDFSSGDPVPPGGLTFNGGDETTGDDMTLEGGSFTTITHTFDNANDGDVDLDGAVITYTGLEPIADNNDAVDRIFTFAATSDDITLSDDGDVGDGESRVASVSSSETVDFTNPTGTLTINAGDGDDDVTVEPLDALFAATITLNGDGGTDSLTQDDSAEAVDHTYTLDDTMSARDDGFDLAFSGFASVTVDGGSGDDTFNVTPSLTTAFTVHGNDPAVAPGDGLDVEMAGITGEVNTGGTPAGAWSFGSGEMDVTYTGIETLLDLADLAITKTVIDFPAPYPGDLVTIEIEVTNLGPDDATSIEVTDVFPPEMVYAVGTDVASDGAVAYDGGTTTLTWDGFDLAFGASATLTFQVTATSSLPTLATNTIDITSKDQGDLDLANNTASADLDIQEPIRFPPNVTVQAVAYWEDAGGNVHPIAGTYNFGVFRGIPEGFVTGTRWVEANEGLPEPLIVNDLLITLDNEIIMSTWGNGGIWRSSDGGRTWTPGVFPAFGKGASSDPIIYAIAEATDGTLYASADRGRFFRSEDGGTVWVHVGDMPVNSSNTAWSLAVDPLFPDVVYAGTFGGGLFSSINRAENFSQVPALDCAGDAPYIFDIEVDPANPARLWLATALGVFTLTDGVCADQSAGLDPFREVRSLAFDPDPAGPLYAAVWGGGVYQIEDRDLLIEWDFVALRGEQVTTLAFHPLTGALAVGTNANGVHVVPLDGSDVATGVEDAPVAAEVPDGYMLDQNYPNPFNPSTRIAFEMPSAAEVRLAVYDALGREVAVLATGAWSAGRHEVTFEAGDLPSGVYLYRLVTPGRVLSRTLVLMK